MKLRESGEAESQKVDSSHLEAAPSLPSSPVSSNHTCSQESAVVASGEAHDAQ